MISTEDVNVTLSGNLIVKGVSMDVPEGKFVGIVGPNGSGKSTFLKSVYRLIKSYSGSIEIGGRDIHDMSLADSAKEIAVVAQHNFFNFDFSVMDIVLMGRTPHKKPMEFDNDSDRLIATEALRKVGMLDFKDRVFCTLSGGEQQRVILARAIAQQTPCLILDEPTNHLDVRYQLQLLDVVRESGLTILCAIHDLNLAAQYCDYIYVMMDGEVFVQGTPEEVLTEDNIREVYGVESYVDVHPRTGKLNIVFTKAIPDQ